MQVLAKVLDTKISERPGGGNRFPPAADRLLFPSARVGLSRNGEGRCQRICYFPVNVGIGFAAMLGVFWTLLELTELHYLVARVAASVVYGVLLFALNGRFNFKEL